LTVTANPSQRDVQQHFASARFQAGVAAGRWRLVSVDWPFVLVAIAAAPRKDSPSEYFIRFELEGYPQIAPTGEIWDNDANDPLAAAHRPKGLRAALLFRVDGWGPAPHAMYAPWERRALADHGDWAEKHPRAAWNPTRDLTFVLAQIHEILNADDYLGS
jgi:hypothetical protein